MPVTSSPVWNAAQAGLIGNAGATAASAQVNQLLTTHPDAAVYQGALVVSPSQYTTGAGSPFQAALLTEDFDQPFTMSGTAIGRVQIPMLPVGAGADLLVSLCADNGSGAPGTVVCQTRLPASWIYQLSSVSGAATGTLAAPVIGYTGNPLAAAQFSMIELGDFAVASYPTPATTGIAAASSSAWYGGYVVQIGGVNSGVALAAVFTIPYSSTGSFGTSIPQPAFPVVNDGSSATIVAIDAQSGGPVVVNTGGGTSFEGPPVATVYTSGLDTSTGALSAWSAQTALPYAVQSHVMATYNGYVYVIGGKNSTGGLTNVSYAQVQNSQITGWTATTPLLQPMVGNFVGVSNGYLFVAGGQNAALSATYTTTWYAAIAADGALGPWIAGPTMPLADFNLNDNAFANGYGIVCGGDSRFSTLTVSASGPGAQWIQSLDASGQYPGFYDAGNGFVATGSIAAGLLGTYGLNLMPYISVPLPATGLTSGATYHVLMQQQGGDLNDYLLLPVSHGVGISAQTSARLAYAWTAWPNDGSHLVGSALSVFNQAPPPAPGILPWHTWSDQGARISTIICATTPDQRLLGLCEATRMGLALNANQGFESGLAPWTWSGGTAVQSTVRSYSGLHSAQITPNGVSASCSFASEIMPCLPGQAVTAAGWFWFTSALTGTFSLSVTWYTAVTGGTPISTTTTLISAGAATWTETVNNLTAVSGAYGWQMDAVLSGTPAASQIWYVDGAIANCTCTGPQQSTITAMSYPAAWPGQTWPPLGSTVLA